MQSFEPSTPGAASAPAEYYLARMGWVWLGMIAVVAVGIAVFVATGRPHTVHLALIGVLVLMRAGYYRLYARYRQAMGIAGLEPLGPESFALIGEVLAHVSDPCRPARPRR
ncbi:MAG: hypothetical protein ACYDHH_24115 [Solirubrobacteraceae bacterium]